MAYKIGTTALNMVTLASLGVPDPKSTFQPYATYAMLSSGKRRGLGLPIATWQFGYLTVAQRNSLRTYCTGVSAAVYIQTRKNDSSDAYDDYVCVMHWPEEQKDAFRRIDFVIEFRNLVEA